MISGFMQNGQGKEAVIYGSAQTGQAAEAMKIFIQMQAAGRKPVTKTYPSMLPAYANLAAPEQEIKTTRFSMEKISDGKQQSDLSASFQIQIRLLSGKTLLQWVIASDLVQDLKQSLEFRLAIPSASQRLLCEGKHLEDLYPLSFYSIRRNASIILTLRLRGRVVGQSSSVATFSYKDAVHAQKPNKAAPPAQAPKPFLVDKLEETPSIEITHPLLDDQIQKYAEHGIICMFNGLWPRTSDLYQWIHSHWTNNCKVLFAQRVSSL